MIKKKRNYKEDSSESGISKDKGFDRDSWKPKTELGKKVKNGDISTIDYILDRGLPLLEPQIVDMLLPGLQVDLLEVGQSKGKFGGGKRSIWRQTQKKTKEGNKPKFSSLIVVGNRDGYIGVGIGKAKDTMPARKKALRNSRLNIMKIKRGCGSWECSCKEPHSIPFKVIGKCGSAVVELIPAPKGTGLCIERELKKIVDLAGIKDIYSKCEGHSKLNKINAFVKALKKLTSMKVRPEFIEKAGILDGRKKE